MNVCALVLKHFAALFMRGIQVEIIKNSFQQSFFSHLKVQVHLRLRIIPPPHSQFYCQLLPLRASHQQCRENPNERQKIPQRAEIQRTIE